MGLLQQTYKKIDESGIVNELRELYSQYGGRALVAERLGISYGSVGHIATHYGFNKTRGERRSVERYCGKVRDPFDGSDFGDYLIGYIIGDGSILVKNGKVRGICISSSDYEHIKKIRDMWDTSIKICGPSRGNYRLLVYDTKLAEKVMSYGIVPAKSKVGMILYRNITDAMLRGLFDSDGSVTITNNGSSLRVMFAGGLEYISQFIKFIGIKPGRVENRGTFVCAYYYTYDSVYAIRERMYKGAIIYLERKYERFYKPVKYRID